MLFIIHFIKTYKAIIQIASTGDRPDMITVKNKLVANGVEFELVAFMTLASNMTFDLQQYTARLHDLAIRRKFYEIGNILSQTHILNLRIYWM